MHAIETGLKGKPIDWTVLDDVIETIVKNVPVLEAIQDVAPDAGYRVHGLKIAREPRRYSGRTAMRDRFMNLNMDDQTLYILRACTRFGTLHNLGTNTKMKWVVT